LKKSLLPEIWKLVVATVRRLCDVCVVNEIYEKNQRELMLDRFLVTNLLIDIATFCHLGSSCFASDNIFTKKAKTKVCEKRKPIDGTVCCDLFFCCCLILVLREEATQAKEIFK
jgi:hypothetical protein